jgi:hypothetical protein
MPITNKTHPYRVKIGDKIVGFPASMSLKDVEIACQKLSAAERPSRKSASTSEEKRPKTIKSAPKTAPKVTVSSRSTAILGDNGAQATADRLSQLLAQVDPKTASEEEKDEIFQQIIGYRKIARSLPDETRAVLDRKMAAFNNSQVKQKPAKKK